MRSKFLRGERLKSRKEIDRLFTKVGNSLTSYPLRLVYAPAAQARSPFAYQAAFVVPKRRYKKAVDRNLIKRRVREAYRLNKHLLARAQVPGEAGGVPDSSRQYALMFIYTGKEAMPFRYIEKKMRKLLRQLAEATAA